MNTRTLTVSGPFSLRESIEFDFGHHMPTPDATMRLAFTVDGGHETSAAVALTQTDDRLDLQIDSAADPDVVAAQVARVALGRPRRHRLR